MNLAVAAFPPASSRPWFAGRSGFLVWLVWQVALPAVCLSAGFFAHSHGGPVTAAMSFMLAVIVIALRRGVRAGLVAGIAVSAIYNFLLSEPALRFSLSSLDDLVPLVAFNVSAVAAAYLIGRLRDEASASALARERLSATLRLSEELQTALDLDTILNATLRNAPDAEGIIVELDDHRRRSRSRGNPASAGAHQQQVLEERFTGGVVGARIGAGKGYGPDLEGQLKLAAMALERWALTQRLTEADILRKSEAFKTTLLSSVSHDLRTPLAVIAASAGSLRHLGDGVTGVDRLELLRTIEQQARRLDVLTGKLLSLGRIEGGLKLDDMPQVDAIELLGAALQQVREAHPKRIIEKSYQLATALVRADPALLEQALFNVVENAAVHTPEQARICISVLQDRTDCIICVDDEGSGIPQGQGELIFERFTQLTKANQGRGSGLGLAIARGFIRAVAGELTSVGREDGRSGSRFLIRIPLQTES